MTQEDFAKLRTLLSKEQSRENFGCILDHFKTWRDSSTLQMGLDYAENHLEEWKDTDRLLLDLELCWPDCPEKHPLPSLQLVRYVDLTKKNHGTNIAKAIAGTPLLQRLSTLRLTSNSSNWMSLEGLQAILQSPYIKKLKRLYLFGPPMFRDEGAKAIANASSLSQLEELFVINDLIKDDGCAAIANSSYMANLTQLGLFGNEYLRNEGAKAIANSPHMANLKYLSCPHCGIDTEGIVAIANSPYMANLEHLNLDNKDFSEPGSGKEGVTAIANSPHMSNLRTLDLVNHRMGPEGAIAIANSPYLTKLEKLIIPHRLAEDEGIIAIANSSNLTSLRKLDLDRPDQLGEQALQAIRRSKHLYPGIRRPYLETLNKKQLYEEAKTLRVPGRSKMTRAKLIEALLHPTQQ